jgi:hypothetical protein
VSLNYFYAHLSSGGKVHVFPLGKHVIEASNGFVRIDRLYSQLVEKSVSNVIADNLVRWPLEFYDLSEQHFRTSVQTGQPGLRVQTQGATALVYYNGPTPMGGQKLEDMRGTQSVNVDGRVFVVEAGFDPNFLVYVHRPAASPD